MAHIAIVDDEKVLVNSLSIALEDEGYDVSTFYDGTSFLDYLEGDAPDICLLDLRLPDMSGLDILKRLEDYNTRVIMITAHGDMNSAIRAMKSGAYDFINKPFELDEIILLIEKAENEKRLSGEVEHLRTKTMQPAQIENIIGTSDAMMSVIESIRKVAAIDQCTVLVRGESGTGKELIARAVHNLSPTPDTPFVDINCSAFPEQLLESELFGYEKGAFTDAKDRKQGLIELADNGTLFLDEIGEMSLNLQAKLLRFLETRTFRRVGGNREIKVSLRIVAATNRNLEEMIRQGAFREDLFYRLSVVPIHVPPLRERSGDVLLIADAFINKCADQFNKERLILTGPTKNIFQTYGWPGNVRELKNLIERLMIMSPSNLIDPSQLPKEMVAGDAAEKAVKKQPMHTMNLDHYLAKIEYELIQDAIIKAKGVKLDAAKLLGISRHSLKRRLQRLEDEGYL